MGEKLTFEQFAARNGASRQDIGDAGLHRSNERQSEKQWQRLLAPQRARDAALVERRAELAAEYHRMVAAGLIEKPSHLDQLLATASGHPDAQSTQAAIRLLARKYSLDQHGAALSAAA